MPAPPALVGPPTNTDERQIEQNHAIEKRMQLSEQERAGEKTEKKIELLGWDGGSRRLLGRVGHAVPTDGRATTALRLRGEGERLRGSKNARE